MADREGVCVSQRSHGFMMPEFHQEKIRKGENVGDYVQGYFKLSADPVVQYVAEMIRGRKPFITTAIKHVLIFYLRREEF
jgi:non-canonical (house-cleaning) NTP pyrophosphatase